MGAIASKVLTVEMVTRGKPSSVTTERAIRVYLGNKGSSGPGWAYPSFLRDRRPIDAVEMQLEIDDSLWRSLEEEAASQNVGAPKLLEHAILYFAAEESAGRLTQRILDDLDDQG
jgi:hypothetical protein